MTFPQHKWDSSSEWVLEARACDMAKLEGSSTPCLQSLTGTMYAGAGSFHPLTRTAASVLSCVMWAPVASGCILPVPTLSTCRLANTQEACCILCVAGNRNAIIFPTFLRFFHYLSPRWHQSP